MEKVATGGSDSRPRLGARLGETFTRSHSRGDRSGAAIAPVKRAAVICQGAERHEFRSEAQMPAVAACLNRAQALPDEFYSVPNRGCALFFGGRVGGVRCARAQRHAAGQRHVRCLEQSCLVSFHPRPRLARPGGRSPASRADSGVCLSRGFFSSAAAFTCLP